MAEYNESQINSNETKREAQEIERINNETNRKSNEIERQEREDIRIEKEDGRLTDEQVRVNAENIRIANENERLRKEIERQNAEELRQIAYNSSLYGRMDEAEDKLNEVNSQLAHIVNVLDKYVVNDGITDNTDIIQNALDNSNYIRISKKGTYITRRLTIHDNTTFELADGVILKQKNNNSDYIIVNDKWKSTDGSYNTNIKIIGGHYDINGANNPRTGNIIDGLYAGIGIVLNNVRNLEVRNIKEIGNALKYCFLFANIENGIFTNINCINASDGLHFQAPCKNIEVVNISGTCHDNLLPFTIGDYPSIVLSEEGDFDNINIKNVFSKDETIDIIRFVGSGKNGINVFRNITIDNVQAKCPNTAVIEIFNQDQATENIYLTSTYIKNILISNVKNFSQTKRACINVFGRVDLMTLENINIEYSNIDSRVVALFEGSDVAQLNINNCNVSNDNQSSTQFIFEQGNPTININNCNFILKGNLFKFITDNYLKLNLSNCIIKCNKVFTSNGSGHLDFNFSNSSITNSKSSDLLDSINMTLFADTTFSTGEGLMFNNSTTGSKRVVTNTLKTNLSEYSLTPTNGDYCLFNGEIKFYTVRNKWCSFLKEYSMRPSLDFGTVEANSFVEIEVDILNNGLPTGLDYDRNYSLIVNLYNAGGANQPYIYTYYLKNNKVYIRMFNLSSTAKAIKSESVIKIIGI